MGPPGPVGPPGPAGSGSVTIAEVEIDFGAAASWGKAFTIIDASITALSKIMVVQSGAAPTGRQADENEMDALICSATPAAGSARVMVTPTPGPVAGKYKLNYTVG